MSALVISLLLGMLAGLANLAGAAIVAARAWSRTFLAYFIAVGSGFMLATALAEIVPESLRRAPVSGPPLILAGYFIVHFFEHSWPAHFHYGEETHHEPFSNRHTAYLALGGLTIHTFFDGVAIASGFLISPWLGTVIFGAVIMHNLPEGFAIASVMAAARRTRAAGLWSAAALGTSRLAGILVMGLARHWVNEGLAISGGVTLYVAASDLIPEVNKMRGIRIALAVASGVVLVMLLRAAFPD
ncbi:MAG TPA: ZIP family metal transporter [Terriglobia bacterium]|jgi:zinc transporter ZupT|nr:ZIP family metal transporter [Terriglobia bacterium]